MASPTYRASRPQSRHPVIERLLADGDRVCAPPVAGCSPTADAAAHRGIVERIAEPVLLTRYSYGDAVITVAGTADSATPGGNMAIAPTLMVKQCGDLAFVRQVLFYPVTDAAVETGSYRAFAEGYLLTHEGMKWSGPAYCHPLGPVRACG
ncbi:alpha/beta hydrolase fold domain-containing protein [Nocardia testacea]|uniref:alpha/beta hydrolase fold domain-containing protein n=1 Tax=Nocardia testacea TaxID=248551 RepID=UPI003C2F5FEB